MGGDELYARKQVKWDLTEFHVTFMAKDPSSSSPPTFNLMRYHAAPSDFCP